MTQILTSPPFFSPNSSSRHFSPTSHPTKSASLPFSSLVECFRVSKNVRRMTAPVCKKMEDGFYMRRCVELARKAIGCTSPNPMVGCVIVKDGDIVGQGFHPKAGQPHAELLVF